MATYLSHRGVRLEHLQGHRRLRSDLQRMGLRDEECVQILNQRPVSAVEVYACLGGEGEELERRGLKGIETLQRIAELVKESASGGGDRGPNR